MEDLQHHMTIWMNTGSMMWSEDKCKEKLQYSNIFIKFKEAKLYNILLFIYIYIYLIILTTNP